ncbi:MAG: alpha/beta hydrolase [Wenzhouxiangellaceae bacterium]
MSENDTIVQPDAFPESAAQVYLRGPAGRLECLTDQPEAEARQPAVAVICHPHPQHGGTMFNKVVTIIERSLRELGLRTVRFNFRGVGDSEGDYDEGHGELDDLRAVINWVRHTCPGHELWLAGFSFGSWIAAQAAAESGTRQLISIAPPVERGDFAAIHIPGCHWLVVQGDEDEVVSPQAVYDWIADAEPKPELIVMKKAGHFFHRRLMDLRGLLKNSLRDHLPDHASPNKSA